MASTRTRLRRWWRYEEDRRGVLVSVLAVLLVLPVAGLLALQASRPPASAGTRSAASPPARPDPPAAFFFGDSYFNGSGYTTKTQSMAYLAGTALGYVTVVGGAGGTGFAHARPVVGQLAAAPDYRTQISRGGLTTIVPNVRLVVVEGGLNDRGEPDDVLTAAVSSVLASAHRTYPTARMVLVGPVDPTGTGDAAVRRVANVLQTVAAREGLPFIDAASWLTPAQAEALIGPDRTHPTVAGHRFLAQKLLAALRRVGIHAAARP